MKIGFRYGHMKNCDCGAKGIREEYDIVREYGRYAVGELKRYGHILVNCTPFYAGSMEESLYMGVNLANNADCDLFLSFHANCFNDNAHGCEALYFPGSIKGKKYAESIVNAIGKLGYTNRGAKADIRGLYELRKTRMPAVIIEPLFCDSIIDMNIYNAQKLGHAIAQGIIVCKEI